MISDPTVTSLLTVIGLGPIVAIVLQAIFRALNISNGDRDRFGPISAIVLGTVLGIAAAFVLNIANAESIFTAVLIGIAAGPSAMGAHDLAKSAGLDV